MAVGYLRLGVLGGGAIAEALVAGALTQGSYAPAEVRVSEPLAERRSYWEERYHVQTTAYNQEVTTAELLLLAIKPQVLPEVARNLERPLAAGALVSVLAGVPLSVLGGLFPGTPLVRAMPNTPALVGAGITALAKGPGITPAQMTLAETLFQAVGAVVQVPETQLDAVTGLSGSGPAYVCLFVEALMDAGVAVGLPRPIARELVLATVSGTIQLIQTENLHPAQLKDRVTSPGGTTIAGLARLEEGAMRSALIQAVIAATERARELGKALDNAPP
ncbi:pyrroline-5-carboxylate reductase [Anthocerotibacter panamensis]|uniref:pyrroline-5-carboxylate reductase n=1 Tax=Anthocerotibacter panamensis TaxID=2857077 RepID=UPI001FDA9505|nr:pyrroline-5-carboxylate reductase [Anthocerotibacter panamensis]